MAPFIHATAEVADSAHIGEGTKIWHQGQIRPGARIGENCILGKGVFVDEGVSIGNNVKIQNYVSVYHGVSIDTCDLFPEENLQPFFVQKYP